MFMHSALSTTGLSYVSGKLGHNCGRRCRGQLGVNGWPGRETLLIRGPLPACPCRRMGSVARDVPRPLPSEPAARPEKAAPQLPHDIASVAAEWADAAQGGCGCLALHHGMARRAVGAHTRSMH